MTRLLFQATCSESQVEMRALGLDQARLPLGWALLLALALTNVAATTFSLMAY